MAETIVSIIAGSESDKHVYEKAEKVLKENKLDDYLKSCQSLVYITVAGLSAALPGVVASKTEKPVIGVPVSAKLGGLDALLSIVQMPPRVPVACVGIDRGENAAYLAIRILNLYKK